MESDNTQSKRASSVDSLYIDFAKRISQESKDPRLKVGCIIATKSGILYPGYNGDEKGGTNVPESLEPGMSGFIHAEENAIIKFNPTIHPDSIMYITHAPCRMCAKKIINTQAISKVYYLWQYRDLSGAELLRHRGIECLQLRVE